MSVKIIAEIGINHNGDIDVAKKLIDIAAIAGWDFVKFQKRNPELCVPDEQKDKLKLTPWGKMTYLEYKIRIECEIGIIKEVTNFTVQIDGDKLNVIPSNELENNNSWDMLGLSLELPLKNIIDNGILPNEVSWLDNFVDYFKGCFMGQEQTSRVKYRGRPRRILKSLPNSTQEIVKI